ncbi:MAG TPA: PilZ domain-containing protein [Bryobacteraceae bacterium]|nr:PilZ domain-containing protein [Bryobacteraceae bacterium]
MTEQRKSKRFELKLPFELIRCGSSPIGKSGETRNLSSSGVLFTADAEMQVGEPIEYMITLPGNPAHRSEVRLRCLGTVTRLSPAEPAARNPTPQKAVAATLERYEFVRERL